MSSNKGNIIQAQFFLGWCYESQKRYKEAVAMFQEAYKSTNKKMFLLRLESAKSKMNKVNKENQEF